MRKCDTIIIGAGIAGLSAAARCARHGEVLVLEAEEMPGMHASGRSVAYLHLGIGDPLIHKLTALSREEFVATPRDDRSPVAETHPVLHVCRANEMEAMDALEEVHRLHSPEYRRLGAEEAALQAPSLNFGESGFVEGLLDPDALKLDGDAMLQGHLRDLRADGGELVCNAPVTGIARKAGHWIIDTPGASYSANRIVNAAGAWADRIADMAGVAPINIRPLRRTVISFKAPDGVDVSTWPFTRNIGSEGFYMLPEGSSRLLASAMDQEPSEPCNAAAEELDIAIAADRIQQSTNLSIKRIEHSWAGLRSFAPDNHPVLGYDEATPGFFWLAGQGGFGLQTSPALAVAAEALIYKLEWPEDLTEAGITPADLSPLRFAG